MKKFFIRLTTMIMAVFTLAIMAALPVTAFAAENEAAAVVVEEAPAYTEQEEEVFFVQSMANNYEEPVIQQLGNPQGGGQQGSPKSGSATADSAYENTVDFIITWVRRAGALVAFFGIIMLALGLKNQDVDAKERGIWAAIAGFVVFAVCGAVDMFDLFS